MRDRVIHSDNGLLNRLLGTAMQIRSMAQNRELDDPRRTRSALEGLRQRMPHDIEAIDAYLQKLQ